MSPLGILLLVGLAYLVGSIPFGVLVARLSGGPDLRTIGSGRTGGTNALRALGPVRAAFVVTGDLAKGALPVLVARSVSGGDPAIEAACAIAAVIGSARSVFLGFHGGRGVATGVGTMLVIQPVALVLATPVFFGVIVVTRYVSLGSLLASAAMVPSLAVTFLALSGSIPLAYVLYAIVGVVVVWIAHADNIDRLRHGTERKFDLGLLAGRGSSGNS